MQMQMQENWEVNLVINAIVVALLTLLLLLYLLSRNYFFFLAGDSERRRRRSSSMPSSMPHDCFVCGHSASKKCSRCKAVPYCSPSCQLIHWSSGHKHQCKQPLFSKPPQPILFPYPHFLPLFAWDPPSPFPPCGLLNCGNSCFANVVLQCLASTRPLVAFLLQNAHRAHCIRTDWCFLCELETHIRRATQSSLPFSPTNIISRLPNIGGNLGYGRQEDAHEFMRFAIDTMQSVCLDEFGGEKAVPPSSQETTVIQHIFGGRLQSQVICTECNNISNQYENMMDLTVEIHGEAASLEECLDQYTKREWLDGDNMYKCDGCNDYVKAWKRLSVKCPPNILTIALKRFQSGRFGKLNKRVSFPERLELKRYTNNEADVYNLYAVVVHVDTLNASYFGHYICYVKDLSGCSWYRLDDCKVGRVELDEVLSQSAYMLLYSRVKARASCLELPVEKIVKKEEEDELIIPLRPDCFTNGNGNGNGHCVEDGPVPVSSNHNSKREEEENHQSKIEDDDDPQHPVHESNGEMEFPVECSKDDNDEMYLSSTSNGDAVESHQHEHEHEEACNSSIGGEEGEIMVDNNTSFKCCGANNTVQNGFHVHHKHHHHHHPNHQSVDMVTSSSTTTTDGNLLQP